MTHFYDTPAEHNAYTDARKVAEGCVHGLGCKCGIPYHLRHSTQSELATEERMVPANSVEAALLQQALDWFKERVTLRRDGTIVLVEPKPRWEYGNWCQFPAHLEHLLREEKDDVQAG